MWAPHAHTHRPSPLARLVGPHLCVEVEHGFNDLVGEGQGEDPAPVAQVAHTVLRMVRERAVAVLSCASTHG